jgi:putative flippase GtrA
VSVALPHDDPSLSAPADASTRPEDPFLHILGRHQLSSFLATTLDYAVMIVMVSLLRLGPVLGTAIGSASGALTNFALNRHFTFKVTHHRARGQLLRYVLVSAGSLVLNAAGVHLVAVELGVQYILGRLIVGTAVGFVWNFPMHRYFVFRH